MPRFYGISPPAPFVELRLGGHCPHCKTGTTYSLITQPDFGKIRGDNITQFVVSYSCDICLGPVPFRWTITHWNDKGNAVVADPKVMIPSKEEFDFEHVPETVKTEIEEALDCLSVGAYNGFAAVCRRAVQAISTDLGAEASAKVKKQIEEMAELAGLDDEWKELAIQVMLSGHDGSHPHLPEVDVDRAIVLLSLLRDLTYQLYTRPGKVKEAADLRTEAIKKRKDEGNHSEAENVDQK